MARRSLVLAFKCALGFTMLAWVIGRNWYAPPVTGALGISDALQQPLRMVPLLLATFLCLVSALGTFFRWYLLVRAQALPFTLSNAIRLGFIGFFFNSMLPGSLSGDIIKAFYIASEQSRRTAAMATVLVDRAVGLCGLTWLVALLGTSFWVARHPVLIGRPGLQWTVVIADTMVTVSILFWFLLKKLPGPRADNVAVVLASVPKIGRAMSESWRALTLYRSRGTLIAISLLVALLGHAGFVLTFYFAAQTFLPMDAIDRIPTLEQHFLILPPGMIWRAIFPSPGGVGGSEYGFGALYRLVGKQETEGVLGSLVNRMIFLCLGITGYLLSLRMKSPPKNNRFCH
jgi:uncharacterized membrane protein YbhN (UPF0104 family)